MSKSIALAAAAGGATATTHRVRSSRPGVAMPARRVGTDPLVAAHMVARPQAQPDCASLRA